jgi:hypothetical protein
LVSRKERIKSGGEISYGQSGGMMLDGEGELIGVITRGEVIGRGGELTLARPINAAIDLIGRAAEVAP